MLSEASYHNMTVGRIPSVEGGIQPTIVDAKGDLIAAVAADSLNRLAVGSNDQVLVADSAASTGLAWKSYGAQVVAGKNGAINGAMEVWQRGTSVSVAASTNAYTTDRWQLSTGATQASTVSRQSTNDTTNLPTIQYCARVQRNSGQTGTSVINFTQSFETINSIPFASRVVTVSLYARAGTNYSAASGALAFGISTGTGTDQNLLGYTGAAYPLFSSATLTTTWQRFTVTGTLAAATNEMGVYIQFTPVGTAGANDYFEVTGVQLEVGSTATPFSRAQGTIQGELAACQRYYFRATPGTNAYGRLFGGGQCGSATRADVAVRMPVTMRTAPGSIDVPSTITWLRLNDGGAYTISAVSLDTPVNADTANLIVTSSGMTTGRSISLDANNNTGAFVGFSAEL
jgi:hypothetical protein